MAVMAKGISLQNYICWAQKKWTQAEIQAVRGNEEIKQDLFNKKLDNLIKHIFIQDNNDK